MAEMGRSASVWVRSADGGNGILSRGRVTTLSPEVVETYVRFSTIIKKPAWAITCDSRLGTAWYPKGPFCLRR